MLKRRFFVQFGSSLVINVIGMLAGIVVARVGGPEVVGVIAYGTAYVSIWGFMTGLFGSGHIKLISEGQNLGNCVKTYAWLQGGSLVVYFLVVAGWFLTQKYILHYPFESTEQQIIIILALFVYVIGVIIQFNSLTFTATMHQVKSNFPDLMRQLLYHTGRIIVVLIGFKAIGLSSWSLFTGIIVLPFVFRQLRQLPVGMFDKELLKKHISFAIPIFLIVVITTLLGYSDKLMLSYFSNTTELGYYSAAYSIGGMFLLLSSVIGTIFFPLFSSLIAKNDWETVNKKIITFQEIAILFIFPFACLMAIIGGPFLVTLLGTRYERSVIPFVILLFSTFFSIVGMPYGNVISGMGRFYLGVWVNIIALVIFFISITFFLSPRFLHLGATGLAFNTLVMAIVNNLLYFFFARKYGKITFSSTNGLRYVFILFISVIIFFLVRYISTWGSFWWIIMIPCYLILMYGLLIVTGLLKHHHWMLLMAVLNVKKTTSYIKEELKIKKVDHLQ